MTPVTVGIIGLCVLLLLIFLNMPIGPSMILVGFIGLCVVRGIVPGLSAIGIEPFRQSATYVLSVIPLFVLMGFLAHQVGTSSDTFYAINKWIGHIRGGLAIATTGACAMFAAISGCAIATATTVGVVALPEMRRYKYADELSTGCIASAGNLGFLIPPSLGFIYYAILTEQSIGLLFMSGILPGLLLTFLFAVTIWVMCRINPGLAPKLPKAGWRERLGAVRYVAPTLVIIALVLGGIYAGIFTPTEAAAVGVFGITVIGLINRRLTWKGFKDSLCETAKMTGMIFVLLIGATMLGRFMAITDIPFELADYISGLSVSPYVVLVAVLILYILIGFVMDIMAMLLLVIPIFHPVLAGLGFDPVWLAVITIITVLMGHISPPVGIVVYALSGMVKDVPMFTIFRGALPFLGAMLVCLIILIAFPQIALFLPHLMRPG